ncbi:MAG TPA: Asp-tRNA(Asn)/Glu-tRNA(Gln) amidotransferase subunit GatA [Patescibacteria group bacterium]|nr:Asp-tRNA(Asn)/Glu-tRNA(Gln) amidotransferase subunit GatA [Patescibacteria group bacterium]
MDFSDLTIKEIHQGLLKKDFSSRQLVESFLEVIRKKDDNLNAFITITDELALTEADRVDKKIKAGKKINLLEGVPGALKDNLLLKGVKATSGSKILANYIGTYDATVVKKLKEQGAVFLGKTNMDEFAMGGSGETSYFGVTKNPRNLKKVPGGSSSGSAAAVASGEAVYALGSDTGGSVRQPAAFCGVVGFKPTYGRNSRYGLMAMASSFDQVGSLTRTTEDAAILFEALAEQDAKDSTTVDLPAHAVAGLEKSLKGLRIGIPEEYFIKGMDEKVEAGVRKAIEKLKKLGAELVQISLPRTKYALSTYYVLMPAEVSSNLARYDGVRYGYRAKSGNLLEHYLKTRRQGLGEETRRRIMLGTYVLSAGYYDAYYKKAQKVRTLIKKDFEKAFEKCDCIATPTSPATAFSLGEQFDDPLTMYLNDIFTVSVNVAGLPAISIPCGQANKLPIGLQFIGQYFKEDQILRLAHQSEKLF